MSVLNQIRQAYAQSQEAMEIAKSLENDVFDYNNYIYQFSGLGIYTGLKVLYLDGETVGMDGDTKKNMTWTFNGSSGTCTVKWQGSSSLAWPKKNYSLKLDTSANWGNAWGRTKWGSQKKYVLKSNYNDFSHAVYMCCARLWGEVVQERGEENVPTLMWDSLNFGAVDGFPVMLVMNGVYIGLYMIMTHKEITTDVNQVDGYYLMGEAEDSAGTTAASFKAETTAESILAETDLSIVNVPDENDLTDVVSSFNTCVNAVINAHQNWQTDVADYLDVDAAFDYYIFRCLLGDADGMTKNQGLVCYNGTKWYHTVYDLDHCMGASGTGSDHSNPEANNWLTYQNWNRVFHLIYTYSKAELKERYFAMREGPMREANVYNMFANYINDIPLGVYSKEDKLWPHTPNTSTASLHQIADWYRLRCKWCDEYINSLT